jgi:hypothetical protein
LENSGLPTVAVATHEFRLAAQAQAGYLGRPDLSAVYVPHPIQDQTKQEVQARADQAISEIVALLTGSASH